MPHVPKRGTQVLGHADAVAVVHARGGIQHRFALEELRFHVGVAFKAPAGQHDAAARFDIAFDAVGGNADAKHFARVRIGNQS